VGAGAAGITLAMELAGKPFRVLPITGSSVFPIRAPIEGRNDAPGLNAKGFDIMAEETIRYLVGLNLLPPRYQKSDSRGGARERPFSRNAAPLCVGLVSAGQFDQPLLTSSARSLEGENA
jgi:hypothetical protein